MKILYCTNQVNTHGGIERILSQKINFLIQEFGFEIYLLTFEQKNKKFVYELNDKLIHNDLNINYIEQISYFHPKNLLKVLKHYFKLKNAINKIKPDLIISISFTPDQYFIPFINKKIPKFKELHSSGIVVGNLENNKNWIVNYFKNTLFKVFKKYNKLILLNNDELKYFNNKNTIVIPNFTDFEIEKTFEKEKTIIAAGRIADVKQFDELIYIWKIIHNEFPDWKIKIFGDGNAIFTKNLKTLIINLGLELSFFIFPSTENILIEMQKASIFAMTSRTECFPMVLLEAQVCGLPIISYDCPNGPRNIINNNIDGFLIENYNRELFSEKLKTLLKNQTLIDNMSINAKNSVKQFNNRVIMDKWYQLFTNFNIKI
jgi:glycosyltransferase involved in cell wall biosynthesis